MAAELAIERTSGVAVFALTRPEVRNALSPSLLDSIAEGVTDLAADDSVVAIVMTSGAGLPFSSGFDLNSIASQGVSLEEGDAALQRALEAIEGSAKPTIAAIRGYAIGAGLELALACDLRLATTDSFFTIPPARLGFLLPLHYVGRLVSALGMNTTKRLMLLGERIEAAEAIRLGLVDKVVAPEAFDAALEEWKTRLDGSSIIALRATKQALRIIGRQPVDVAAYSRLLRDVEASDDYREGIAAFKERRPPRFRRST